MVRTSLPPSSLNHLKHEIGSADFPSCVDPTYLPGHAAAIMLQLAGKKQRIGTFGILHPTVLKAFELPFPASTLELNVEVFL